MHIRSFVTVLMAVVAFAAAVPSSAQMVVDKNRSFFSPDQQWGFGVNNRGLHVQYALGPAFHIGLNLALDFYKDSAHSVTYYDFGPYAKFLFSGDVIKPYAFAALGLIQPSTGKANLYKNPPTTGGQVEVVLPDPEIRVYLGFGGEHFFNQNVGVYGHVNLLDALLAGGNLKDQPQDSRLDVGLLGATAGIEFFF